MESQAKWRSRKAKLLPIQFVPLLKPLSIILLDINAKKCDANANKNTACANWDLHTLNPDNETIK